MQITKSKLLFLITVAWGAMIFWIAPHPPMADLPQHAGQVILLRDILLGQSPWANQFRINLFTPYLMGYALALPLSLIMPITMALKLLLSLAYIAFVSMCVKLRQHFGVDSRLDWLFPLAFFGFAYICGFYTFLIAAPFSLWFILITDRYAQNQTIANALKVVALGLILLFSHGLIFLFALTTGFALLIIRIEKFRDFIIGVLPFIFLVSVCAYIFLWNLNFNVGMGLESVTNNWSMGPQYYYIFRLPRGLLYTVSVGRDSLEGIPFFILVPTVVVFLSTPWLLGLSIDWNNKPSWIAFFIVALIIEIVPSHAIGTALLYERFSLFLIPAYAWMFTKNFSNESQLHNNPRLLVKLAVPILVIMNWSSLSVYSVNAWNFSQETADFDAILKTLKPEKRALSFVLDAKSSKLHKNFPVYGQYPSWYQAEKRGLVDFNFAWFTPMIVRHKPDHLPGIPSSFQAHPEYFDWVNNRGNDYEYFFVRHSDAIPVNLFKGADCQPTLLVASGMWTVFERTICH